MTLTHDISHATEARGRLLEQYKGNVGILALIDVFLGRTQLLEDSGWTLQTLRTLAASIGAQLDGLGEIVGLIRNGRGDDTYRIWLGAQILANSSMGDPARLINIAVLTSGVAIKLVEESAKTAVIEAQTIVAVYGEQIYAILQHAKSGGNRCIFYWWDTEPVFAFYGDTGSVAGFDVSDDLLWIPLLRAAPFSDYPSVASYLNGLWIAAGNAGLLSTSEDAGAWTARTSQFGSSKIYCAAYGNGRYVIGGVAGKISSSTDGQTWVSRTSGFGANDVTALTWTGTKFIAVGVGGYISTSSDGETWSVKKSSGQNLYAVANCPATSMAVCAGENGSLFASADNGSTWIDKSNSTFLTTETFRSIAVTAAGFFFVCGSGGFGVRSANPGVIWGTMTTNMIDITKVIWDSGKSILVAIGQNVETPVMDVSVSTNYGSLWTLKSSGFSGSEQVLDISSDPSGGWLIGSGGNVASSDDLRSWSEYGPAFSPSLTSASIGYGNGIFFAMDNLGESFVVYDLISGGTFASAKG